MSFGMIISNLNMIDKAWLCYIDTDSLVINIKTEDFYKDIASEIKKLFDISNYGKNDK